MSKSSTSHALRVLTDEELLNVDSGLEDNEVPDSEDLYSMDPSDLDAPETEWIVICSEDAVKKKLLENGGGWETPREGFSVTVHFAIRLEENDSPVYDTRSEEETPLTFRVGSAEAIPALDIAVPTMKRGERALLRVEPVAAFGPQGSLRHAVPPASPIFMDVTLLSWREELSVTKDDSVHKLTVKQGDSWDMPKARFTCKLHYEARVLSGKVVFSTRKGDPVEAVIGEGHIPLGLELALCTMKRDERATVKCSAHHAYGEEGNDVLGIPAGDPVVFDVELVSFVEGPQPWNMSGNDKISFAEKCLENGKSQLEAGKFEAASGRFGTVLEFLSDNAGFESKHAEKRKALLCEAHLGNAGVCRGQRDWSLVVKHSRLARKFDRSNPRVSYNMGVALMELGELDDARMHLDRAVKLLPKDSDVVAALARVLAAIEERDAKLVTGDADASETDITTEGSLLTQGSDDDAMEEEAAAATSSASASGGSARRSASGRLSCTDLSVDGEMSIGDDEPE
eukprot:TRINITY_DN1096_c2_g1_i1.p1 TRINITY_DN1096_c2_g1~~TRINITY_DN1096_c2_g1_i1.p1  ORF type:complete len:512 (+),score=163.32 TRINITY_DN1096_c2_g1_i1:136-1671(+)